MILPESAAPEEYDVLAFRDKIKGSHESSEWVRAASWSFPFWPGQVLPGTHSHTRDTRERRAHPHGSDTDEPHNHPKPTNVHARPRRPGIRGRLSQNPFNTGRLLILCNSHNAPHLTHKCGKMLHVHLDGAAAAKKSRIFLHNRWWKCPRKVRIVFVPQS